MPNKKQIALKNEYLNKPHQVIHIEGKLDLIQHKCWNIFAVHALKNGLRDGKQRFEIAIPTLYKVLGYTGENNVYFKKILNDISKININGDLFDEDGRPFWISFNLLAQCIVKDGICYYEYPSFVSDLLSKPKIYVKLLMKLQNQFNGSYALKLYEFLKTKYIEKQGWGTSGELTLEAFRQLMGIADISYKQFKELKKWVIIPAIKEINEKTDLFVKLELVKNKQKVIALKFEITENPNKDKNLRQIEIANVDELHFEQGENKELKAKLEKLGFGENQINEFLADPEPQKVLDCADYVIFKLGQEIETNKTKNKIQSPTGYFFMIYNMYEDIDFSGLKDWRAKEKKQAEEAQIRAKEELERQEQEAREQEKQAKRKALILEYMQSHSAEVEAVCEGYLAELATKNHFTLEQVKKEAKKRDVSMVEAVKTCIITKAQVETRVWEQKMELAEV